MLTFYAFVAIFPLLLLASSIFGFVLQGRPDLQEAALNSALAQFPIIGDQLGRPEGLTGSVTAVVVGVLAAIYGALGLGQAIQNVMNTAWAVPRNSRPNPVLMRAQEPAAPGRSPGCRCWRSRSSPRSAAAPRCSARASTPPSAWLIALGHRAAGHRGADRRCSGWRRPAATPGCAPCPGRLVVALGWQGLQLVGASYTQRVLAQTSALNQTFGLVLGLIGLIFFAAIIGVLGIEVNVVLARAAVAAGAAHAVHRRGRPHRRRPACLRDVRAVPAPQGLRDGHGALRRTRRRHPRDRAGAAGALGAASSRRDRSRDGRARSGPRWSSMP